MIDVRAARWPGVGRRALLSCFFLLVGLMGLSVPLAAQGAADPPAVAQDAAARPEALNEELQVATRVVAPFVIQNADGTLSGFSVDLWRAVAAEAGLKSHFKVYGPLHDLLEAVREAKDPVGISAVSITAERELVMDFSQPMFRSGLAIMVPVESGTPLGVIGALFSEQALQVLGLFFLVLLIPAHIIWFTQRGRTEENLTVSRSYFPGILQSIAWAAEGMVAVAPIPRHWSTRIVAIIWTYAGVVLIAYFTALAATTLTVSSLRGSINGPGDLVGKSVATIKGSTSERFLSQIQALPVGFDDFQGAVAALEAGRTAALVYDAPILLYHATHGGAGKVEVVGEPFRIENYGILFPAGSELRRPVNAALLKVTENGTYQQIYDKWFAKKPAAE